MTEGERNEPVIPDREGIEEFADLMIKHDKYVALSVTRDGYMKRDEYVISTWVQYYLNENALPIDGPVREGDKDPREEESLLQDAYRKASEMFGITPRLAEELYEKSLTIRSRHMDLDKI